MSLAPMSSALTSSACRFAMIATGAALALTACTSSGTHASPAASTTVSASASVSASPVASASTSSTATSSTAGAGVAVGTRLLTSANAVCAAAIAYGAKHPFPYPQFSPTDPRVELLPKVAAYYRHTPDVVAQLIALPAPSTGKAQWAAVVAVLRRLAQNEKIQTAAAESADRQAYVRAVKAGGLIFEDLRTTAAAAGLLSAESCVAYFRG